MADVQKTLRKRGLKKKRPGSTGAEACSINRARMALLACQEDQQLSHAIILLTRPIDCATP